MHERGRVIGDYAIDSHHHRVPVLFLAGDLFDRWHRNGQVGVIPERLCWVAWRFHAVDLKARQKARRLTAIIEHRHAAPSAQKRGQLVVVELSLGVQYEQTVFFGELLVVDRRDYFDPRFTELALRRGIKLAGSLPGGIRNLEAFGGGA